MVLPTLITRPPRPDNDPPGGGDDEVLPRIVERRPDVLPLTGSGVMSYLVLAGLLFSSGGSLVLASRNRSGSDNQR